MKLIKSRLIKFVAVIVTLLIFINIMIIYKITNCDAIQITKGFYSKMNIKYDSDPFIPNISLDRLIVFGLRSKPTIVGKTGKRKLIATVDCVNSELVNFTDEYLMSSYIKTHTVLLNNKKEIKWSPFISEQNAKDILISLASQIGIPKDAELSEIRLNKISGLWTGQWTRKFNGFVFESDYINISIMAVDGVLYGFSKNINGKPCSTEIKISRDDAIRIARNKFSDYFSKDTWDNNKDKFEVKSAELKIVQENSFLKRVLLLPNKSRLAWVVIFDTKTGMDRETIGILKEDLSFIRVDAATKQILSSEINVVH